MKLFRSSWRRRVALVVGMALVPFLPAAAASAGPAPGTLVPATTWELDSATAPGGNAFFVGYSTAPSTAPVAIRRTGSVLTVTPTPHPSGGAVLLSTSGVPGTADAWAGGESCTTAACPGAFLLQWQGSAWKKVHLPHVAGSSAIISVSAASATDAWAVGQTCSDHTFTSAVLLLHWNGTSWSKVTAPVDSDLGPYVYSVADLSPTDAWAVGGTDAGALALHWKGKSWISAPVPGNGFGEAFNEVAAIPGTSNVWLLGAGSGGSFMSKWNGATFANSPLPHPSTGALSDYGLTAVAASSAANAWAVGYSFSDSGTTRTVTLHWLGGKWSAATSPDPSPSSELLGVAAASATDAWAVGSASSLFQDNGSGLVLQWSGTAWAKVKVPVPDVPATATPRAGRLTRP